MLQAIRAGLPRAHLPEAQADLPPLPAGAAVEPAALVEQFSQELAAVGGHVYRPDSPEAAIDGVLDLLRSRGATAVIAWAAAELPLPGLAGALDRAGITRHAVDLPAGSHAERRQALAALAGVPAGLTGALAGIANNGSLALVSGPGRSRLASLLPPLHVALLPVERLYPDLGAFLQAQPQLASPSAGSNLVLITGPSRTADIEMTLTIGVHGPKEVHVFLI